MRARNQFLDHLLARFGEQHSEYALLLTDALGAAVAQPHLIASKIDFLKRYPEISRDRARAANYRSAPNSPSNRPVLQTRIGLLLGHADRRLTWSVGPAQAGTYPVGYTLVDNSGRHWLVGKVTVAAGDASSAETAAYELLIDRMGQPTAYAVTAQAGRFLLLLLDAQSAEIGRAPTLLDTEDEANSLRDELVAWSALERVILVEHLLLRPKFVGDALYPACCEGGCDLCGCEDPYSFRLTFVMPGWMGRYADNMDLRRFAERTIREQTPSHLLAKICWVGNDGFMEDLCDGVIDKVAGLLISEGRTADGRVPTNEEACACATGIYLAFSRVFNGWYVGKKLTLLHTEALESGISALLRTAPASSDVTCAAVLTPALWARIQALMIERFVEIAVRGSQLDRFEHAWRRWRMANAAIDWTRERLQERIEATLVSNMITAGVDQAEVCRCAMRILVIHGKAFSTWLDREIAAGASLESLSPFEPPEVGLCKGISFKEGTAEAVAALLADRYGTYRVSSYWLRIVINLLSGISSVYPSATLHDCDDGSDQNPVRLDSTALGDHSRRKPST